MSFLLDIWNKVKSYGLVILSASVGVLYLLLKRSNAKNESLTRENSDLHAANEEMGKAAKEKAKNDEALRKANEAINNTNPVYHYPDSK